MIACFTRTFLPALAGLFLALLSLAPAASGLLAQNPDCADCRYISPVFDQVEFETVAFGSGENINGGQQVLEMDIRQPVGDTASLRPLFIFAFGGGFVQGSRDEYYVARACEMYSQAGYVTASPDYRIANIDDPLGLLPAITQYGPQGVISRVLFLPVQDMRAAIQWFKASVAEKGNPYRIDTNRIYIGGGSAGAITALNTAYCKSDSQWAEVGPLSAIQDVGGFFSSSSDSFGQYDWSVQGVVNIAGALRNPAWIQAGDPPALHAHGDQDDVVPFKNGDLGLQAAGLVSIELNGSYLVDSAMQDQGLCSYLYTQFGEGHPRTEARDPYLRDILNRFMPRMSAWVRGLDPCCPNDSLSVSLNNPGLNLLPEGDRVDLTPTVQDSQPGLPVDLRWCANPCYRVSGQNTLLVAAPDTGQDHFMVVAEQNGCLASDFATLELEQEVTARPDFAEPISAYPNPTRHYLQVQAPGPARLSLLNLQGQVVLHNQYPAPATQTTYRLDLSDQPAGVYLLRVEPGQGRPWSQRILLLD